MHNQSRDEWSSSKSQKWEELKTTTDEMSKEELIISLLKSKQSIAELLNNNLDHDKISDIKRILNRLRDIPKNIERELKKKLYEIENKENLSEA